MMTAVIGSNRRRFAAKPQRETGHVPTNPAIRPAVGSSALGAGAVHPLAP
jgi:hypothetical protein